MLCANALLLEENILLTVLKSKSLFQVIDPVTENCSCQYYCVPRRVTKGRDLRKLTQQGLISYYPQKAFTSYFIQQEVYVAASLPAEPVL